MDMPMVSGPGNAFSSKLQGAKKATISPYPPQLRTYDPKPQYHNYQPIQEERGDTMDSSPIVSASPEETEELSSSSSESMHQSSTAVKTTERSLAMFFFQHYSMGPTSESVFSQPL